MDEIRFVDTTLRDGHQSLWAERMTTGMMLPVARTMDEAGFDAIELMSASHLKKCVRELKGRPLGPGANAGGARHPYPVAADGGEGERVRDHPGIGLRALHRADGGQRHPPSAYFGGVERVRRVAAQGRHRPQERARAHRQPHLFGVAQAHRRVLRAKDPGGRIPEGAVSLPQGSRRAADSRAHPHPGADDLRERRRHPGGAAHPLHHRAWDPCAAWKR